MTPQCVVALDVGGTTLKAALVDEHGASLMSQHIPTEREHGPEAVLARITTTVQDITASAEVRGLVPIAVGVVVPGIVDEDAGLAVYSANIGWRHIPLRSLIEDACGLPVALGHDVRAGGTAERALGAARSRDEFLFLAVGTGVAAAMMLAGRPYAGGGYGGEIGHVVVDPEGPLCSCGAHGCLETLASASPISTRYAQRVSARAPVSAAHVSYLARHGDPAAAAVWEEAVRALVDGLSSYVSLLAPELIVVGGGLAAAGDQLLHPLKEQLYKRLTFQRRPDLVRAQLGERAGCIGAALLAWQRVKPLAAVASP
nr:ROK family protein [Streptomyces sp. NBC_00886]